MCSPRPVYAVRGQRCFSGGSSRQIIAPTHQGHHWIRFCCFPAPLRFLNHVRAQQLHALHFCNNLHMFAVAYQLQDLANRCPGVSTPCTTTCHNVFTHIQQCLIHTPEFQLTIVLISSPVALLVALWGMQVVPVFDQIATAHCQRAEIAIMRRWWHAWGGRRLVRFIDVRHVCVGFHTQS